MEPQVQLQDVGSRLLETLQDLADQCRQFTAFADAAPLTRTEAREAQMPVRGAARQAMELTQDYLNALTAYADSLPE